jgi:hypothetical protein
MSKECREHHFNESTRCTYCQMQARYYYEVMATLNSWPKDMKADPDEHWQEKVDSFKCKPHVHREAEK